MSLELWKCKDNGTASSRENCLSADTTHTYTLMHISTCVHAHTHIDSEIDTCISY